METKICNKCYKLKPLSDFYFRNDTNAYRNDCKSCKKEAMRNYSCSDDGKFKRQEYYKNNINQHIRRSISSRLHSAVKQFRDNEITIKYLRCSIQHLKSWLEFQFYDEITFENYGKYWHIDHTLPVNCFNFENEIEIMKCFCWINLRPLRADKNIRKSDKVDMREYLFQEIKAIYFIKNYIW